MEQRQKCPTIMAKQFHVNTLVLSGQNLTTDNSHLLFKGLPVLTGTLSGQGTITVIPSGNYLIVSGSSPTGAGESNTASNLSSGVGIFAQKSSVDLQFKSLVGNSGISLLSESDKITIGGPDTSSFVTQPSMTGYVGQFSQIGLFVDNGTGIISTGSKGYFQLGNNMQLKGWSVVANTSGNLSIDVQTSDFNTYPAFSSIISGTSPYISGQIKNNGIDLSNWNTTITKGSFVKFIVTSSSISQFGLTITGVKYV